MGFKKGIHKCVECEKKIKENPTIETLMHQLEPLGIEALEKELKKQLRELTLNHMK